MTIDSNIVIGYLNEDRAIQATLSAWKVGGKVLLISTVSVAELLSFETLTDREIVRTSAFLEEHFLSIPVGTLIAQEAGSMRRRYGLKLPDAMIAATALVTHTPLVTNDKDFASVPELELIRV